MIVNDSEKSQNVSPIYQCELCDYVSSKKSDYNKHLATVKHKNHENGSKMIVNDSKKSQKVAHFECDCGKIYKYDSGYYRHKKNCNVQNLCQDISSKNDVIDKDLIMLLIKENSELKNMMIKVIENGINSTTTNNSHNTISNNKTFNLNFFLNETCKNAMNIMDFVDSIKLQLSDLEGVGELGYVDGISNIIVKNLKELDVTQRPLHCTDKKRETMYIKDEDKWEKDEEKKKLHKVVRKVTCKNQNLIPTFKETHPDCSTYHSKFSDQYNKIIIESMGGKGDNDYEKEEKIIKNISKQVFIDKEQVL
jgi:hypothetical protein